METDLISPEQQQALALSSGLVPSASNIARVSAATSEEAARWAFLQWELRSRGAPKFDLAELMLFDRDGLEMATSLPLARYHASKFPTGEEVVDMTVGLGADLIALAERGPAVGIELDPGRAKLANHNLQQYGVSAQIIQGDSLDVTAELINRGARFSFCDPARRLDSRRSLDPESFSPDPIQVAQLYSNLELGGLKLSPMLPDSFLQQFDGTLEFVSIGGECKEALVWSGGGRGCFAVHVQSGERLEVDDEIAQVQETPGEYLYEADPAAIRAHALPQLCAKHSLLLLADSNGYLTGPKEVNSAWLKGYEVLAALKGDMKETRRWLRSHNAGTPIVKSRAKIDVTRLRQDLRGEGEELIVAAYPSGRSIRHAILRPLAS